MESDTDGHIPFLDIDFYRKPDGSLGHRVYRKPTRTNLYLNTMSHHHPANIQAVLSTLVHHAKAVCDTNSLSQEVKLFWETFRNNGCGERQILCALNPPKRAPPPCEDHTSMAFLPFIDITFNCISRALSKYNSKTVGFPPRKLSSFLHPMKDHVALKVPGVYIISCECGKVYIGQTGWRTSMTYLSCTS
jgi:hypothetical protein